MTFLFIVLGFVLGAVVWQRVNVISTRLEKLEKRLAKMQHAPAPVAEHVQAPASGTVPVEEEAVPPSVAEAAAFESAPMPRELMPGLVPLEPEVELGPAAPVEPVPQPEPALQPEQVAIPEPPPPAPPPPAPPPPPPPPPPPERPRAATPPKPREASLIERMLEGNLVAKVGVVILFFGFAFLLKFAYERGFFPPWMRLIAVGAAAAALFVIGQKLLKKERLYAVILMGGAMGLAYLDVFFALKTFQLISPAAGFGLFAVLGVATLALAVRLDARAIAVLGMLGGFLAPILASSGGGHHVLLFSYYLLLNVVIVATSWFRSWRELNFVGFLFTFAIGVVWGYTNYRPELFDTVEPFLVAFFLLYLAIPILFAHRQPPQLRGIVDATLVFGMPLSAAMMQSALTRGMGDRVLAWSAALAAVVYAVLARSLWNRPNMRLLAEAHVALAIVFGTVAPYFAFEGYPTFAFWTIEGAAIYWIGCRQQSTLARTFALLLQLGAAPYFWWVTRDAPMANAIWNERVIGCALIAAASVTTAWLAHRFEEVVSEVERNIEGWIITWGGAWLLAGAWLAVSTAYDRQVDRLGTIAITIAAALAVAEYAGRRLDWPRLRAAIVAHVPLLAVIGLRWIAVIGHPLYEIGMVAWPLALVVHFHLVNRQQRDGVVPLSAITYGGAWILLIVLASCEAAWRWNQHQYAWVLGIGVAGLIAAYLRFRLRERDAGKAMPLSGWVIAWSLIWWFAGWHGLVEEGIQDAHHLAVDLGIAAATVLAFELAGRALEWTALRRAQVVLPLALVAAILVTFTHNSHPFAYFQAWSWLAAFGILGFTLYRQERDGVALSPSLQYAGLFAMVFVLGTWEALWRWRHAQHAWVVGIGVAGLVGAGLRYRLREMNVAVDSQLSTVMLLWALVWWFLGLHGIIDTRILDIHHIALHLLMVVGSVLAFEIAGRALAWPMLRRVEVLLPVSFAVAAAFLFRESGGHPFAYFQLWAWAAGFAVAWFALARQERDRVVAATAAGAQHFFLFASVLVLLAWEADWRVVEAALGLGWRYAALGAAIALGIGVATAGIKRDVWPFAAHAETFTSAIVSLFVVALAWTLAANVLSDGDAAPFVYVPVLNPLDIAQLLAFAAVVAAIRPGGPVENLRPWAFLAAAAFLWLNAAVLRTVHHWGDVPWHLRALMHSVVAQAALSLLWTATALVLMFVAGRRRSRPMWMGGAALLALVIAKLFLNDLGGTGTVARIVSFIGVGVFMLVIGYISPVPPKGAEPMQ
jgi:uncharacterized membrane protein